MSNYIHIPKLNPISFRDQAYVGAPQYLSHHFDDYRFEETLQPWEQKTHYCQKILTADPPTTLQFISNFDPLPVDVVNQYGQTVLSQNATQKLADRYNPGYYAYEASINWASFAPGGYFVKLPSIFYVSEPIILGDKFENTLLYSYFHTHYHEDVIFETGIKFYFRVEGHLGRLLPKSNDQFFIDQKQNPYLLNGKPYGAFPHNIGGQAGVPDWTIQLMNYIWSCNNVLIDGKSYGRNADSKFDVVGEDHYPMRSINMEIMPGTNRGSKIVNPTLGIGTDQKLVVSYNIASDIFGGLGNDSGNVIVVTNFE